jgi:hypothetical protein
VVFRCSWCCILVYSHQAVSASSVAGGLFFFFDPSRMIG